MSNNLCKKQNNKKLKKVDKNKSDILDRFLRILQKKEVEYKINIRKIIFEGDIL